MSLILENIEVALPDFVLRANVALQSPFTGLTAPSGAGKTTLMELIAGLREARRGRVILDGVTLVDCETKMFCAPEKRRVGYVPQDLALFPHMSAKQNLLYGAAKRDGDHAWHSRVFEILELEALLQRSTLSLSGGEKQRVALGRALLSHPRILLLDEPLSSLDDRLKQKIMPCLQQIREELGVPIVFVSHAKEELASLCDEVLTIRDGEVQRLDNFGVST